jgi:hypothetical protein
MADARLINELVRRARLSPSDAEAALNALAEVAAERHLGPADGAAGYPAAPGAPAPPSADPFVPDEADVEALIASARRHPLGIDFLIGGHLGSVAVTFKTHAFTVEAARARIWTQQ